MPDFPDYEVSDLGRVRSWKIWGRKATDPPRLLTPGNTTLYDFVVLLNGDKRRNCLVHRLVLEAFVGPCPEGMEARHLNGSSRDNSLENLEWASHMENMQDKVAHGTLNKNRPSGDSHPSSVLDSEAVRAIRREYASGGITQQALADKYKTSRANIGLIVTRKNWKQVD